MYELFKTVLILSLFGFGITALLLCLKPITAKKFPAKWQYYVWVAVLFSMIIPVYKLIPEKEAQKLPLVPQNQVTVQEAPQITIESPGEITLEDTPMPEPAATTRTPQRMKNMNILAHIWLLGMGAYLLVVIISYLVYVNRKRKNAVTIEDNSLLHEVKQELKIKRKIKTRISGDYDSPMLVGVLFPVIYLPRKEIPAENLRMVYLHELTHYKRKDLLIKWLSLFVNAVHWFNPLAYLLCSNVSESCEVSCDMQVTKNMSDTEQKVYMKTILDLVE